MRLPGFIILVSLPCALSNSFEGKLLHFLPLLLQLFSNLGRFLLPFAKKKKEEYKESNLIVQAFHGSRRKL